MVVRVKAAVAFFANLTDRLSYAGCFATGVIADFFTAVVAEVIVICVFVVGNGLAANIADMVFICIFMQTHISALAAHAVCPFVIFIRYTYGIAAVPFFLVGSGCLCPLFRAGMIDGVGFAVRLAAMGANGFFGAGCRTAGVLRIAVLSRVIRHIAVFIGTFMPVMRCIGRPIGLPAMARSWNRLYFCCVALGAAICLFARFCAGRRCCYRTAVPSMRAFVLYFITTGAFHPMVVIIILPNGEIMPQSIAIFHTANGAVCFLGAGRFAAGVRTVSVLCGIIILHIAVGIQALMPMMRRIVLPRLIPAVTVRLNRLVFCRAAFVTGIYSFALRQAGRRYGHLAIVPNMRVLVILCITAGAFLPVGIPVMMPYGCGEIVTQSHDRAAADRAGNGLRAGELCGVAGVVAHRPYRRRPGILKHRLRIIKPCPAAENISGTLSII